MHPTSVCLKCMIIIYGIVRRCFIRYVASTDFFNCFVVLSNFNIAVLCYSLTSVDCFIASTPKVFCLSRLFQFLEGVARPIVLGVK